MAEVKVDFGRPRLTLFWDYVGGMGISPMERKRVTADSEGSVLD